jgi:ribosomal protein S18 acetylase RimI-like enzyme
MNRINIAPAAATDAQALADLFIGHITDYPEYISHGEMQMGVGEGILEDGQFVMRPAPDAREKWMRYILKHIEDDSFAEVWKAVDTEGRIQGFCVADIEDDGDAPFGMVCDVLVRSECRGGGVGNSLLETAVHWLRSRGITDIYLESGKNNSTAHHFFEKRGFLHISEIYKLV